MGLADILGNIFKTKTADPQRQEIVVSGSCVYAPAEQAVQLQRLAQYMCKDYIASAVGKCEFRTFLRGRETKGDEYYIWNVSPNPNQTSTEFWREVIYKLYDDTEVLIVPFGDKMIVADGFTKQEYAVKPSVFTNISKGDWVANRSYTSETAIYLSLPEGITPSNITSDITSLLNNTLSEAANKYKLEGGEKGTFEYDSDMMGDEKYNDAVNKALEEDFAAYFSARSAVMPIYAGMKYTPFTNNSGQKTSIVNDITSLLDQAVKVVAQSYKIPPALILGEVADTKTAVDNLLTFCIDPLLDMITEAMNAVRYGKRVLEGSCIEADTTAIKHVDALSIAGDLDKLISARIYNTNEIRRKIGEPKINESWADEYVMTKNYEAVTGSGASDKEDNNDGQGKNED